MLRFPNITLAILAGGKALRMGGENKALLKLNGQTFISIVHQKLSPLFAQAIIISNDTSDFGIPSARIYPDIISNIGPLGGLHSAMVNANNPYLFVVSCDMPFADASIAKLLANEFLTSKPEILIPVYKGYNEPLFALYSKCLSKKIEETIQMSGSCSLSSLFVNCNTLYYELPDSEATQKCFTNINSTFDYNKLLKEQ